MVRAVRPYIRVIRQLIIGTLNALYQRWRLKNNLSCRLRLRLLDYVPVITILSILFRHHYDLVSLVLLPQALYRLDLLDFCVQIVVDVLALVNELVIEDFVHREEVVQLT